MTECTGTKTISIVRPHPLLGRIAIYRMTETEFRPALIVRVWSDTCVQLLVFPDGSNPPDRDMLLQDQTPGNLLFGGAWRTSVTRGDGVGMWLLPKEWQPPIEEVMSHLGKLQPIPGPTCEGFTCVSKHPCGANLVTSEGERMIFEKAAGETLDVGIELTLDDQGQIESAKAVKIQQPAPATTLGCSSPRTPGDTAANGITGFGGCPKTNE